MAWLSSNGFTPSDFLFADDLNNLANDDRTWGGNVNGGGYILSNVILQGVTFPGTVTTVFGRDGVVVAQAGDYTVAQVTGALPAPSIAGISGQVLTVDAAAPLGVIWADPTGGGGGGGGAVDSVFNRIGNVAAEPGDYTAAMITNAVDQTQSYANPAWITSLAWAKITGAPPSNVTSVFGRTGVVAAATGDYTVAQVTGAMADPTTTLGDLIVRGGNAPQRLGIGADGQVLTVDSVAPLGVAWANPTPGGGGGGSQTPWASDINGAGYLLFNAGGIGIGTQPSVLLEVWGQPAVPTMSTANAFNPSGTLFAVIGAPNGLTVGVWDGSNNYATWLQSGFTGNVVDPYPMLLNPFGGNVGINQPNPVGPLTVSGNGAVLANLNLAQLALTDSTTVNRLSIGYDTTVNVGALQAYTSGGSVRNLTLNPAGGNVGIGTATPSDNLTIAGVLNDGQLRIVNGGYGTFWRNDGAALYLMTTNDGDPYGSAKSPFPMIVDLATCVVSFGATLVAGAGLTVYGAGAVSEQLVVGPSAIGQGGDLGVARVWAPSTGAVFFGNTAAALLYYDGTDFNLLGANALNVTNLSVTGAIAVGSGVWSQAGDLGVARTGAPGTGIVFFGNTGAAYISYNGSQFDFQGGSVDVPASLNVGGNVDIGGTLTVGPSLFVNGNCNVTGGYYINGLPISTGGGPTSMTVAPPYFSTPNGGRANGTTYQNALSLPIFVSAAFSLPYGGVITGYVNGSVVQQQLNATSNITISVFLVVPAGSSYSINVTAYTAAETVVAWVEWR